MPVAIRSEHVQKAFGSCSANAFGPDGKYAFSESNPFAHLAQKTQQKLKSKWSTWISFCIASSIDSDQHWIDLALGKIDEVSNSAAFLKAYYFASVRETADFEDSNASELKQQSRVGSAVTLEDLWTCILRWADATVMHQKRLQNPGEASFWTFSYQRKASINPLIKSQAYVTQP